MSVTVRVIPCLDVDSGRVVKGTNFVNLRDAGDPIELAALYDRQGADELIFLDITASVDQRDTTVDMARQVAEQLSIPFTIGGGVRSVADARKLLLAGADKVGVNSAAVARPALIEELRDAFGAQAVVVAIDAKQYSDGWHVVVNGGRDDTGRDALEWVREVQDRGAGEILLTSMDRDGAQTGYDLALLRAVSEHITIPVIASGGAGSVDHMIEAARDGHADAVLVASLFHFGTVTIAEAKMAMHAAGVPVRLVSTT
ncbi:imidazole glycerol phosphate synthase subunit HisF [Stomatohabitans albus]|uniref:imidazole glycerol phosphate synthase subunit HisF n=1 Tax=Stomatohabitans albus TaxID=3110766 RepID=UPI00300C15F2